MQQPSEQASAPDTIEAEKASTLALMKRTLVKLGISSEYTKKSLLEYGTYGATVKNALDDYPRSVAFLGENGAINDLFYAATLYAAVKLGQNVIPVDVYRIKEFADNNDLTKMVECSTRNTSLFINGFYNDKMMLDTDRIIALHVIVREAKRLKIPVHFYAYCDSWKEMESFYSKKLLSLLKIDCVNLGRDQ